MTSSSVVWRSTPLRMAGDCRQLIMLSEVTAGRIHDVALCVNLLGDLRLHKH